MPFIDGKRVTRDQWIEAHTDPTPMPDLSEDEADRIISTSSIVPGAPRHARTPSKAAQAKAAILAATGANAESLDAAPEPVLVAIDLDDVADPQSKDWPANLDAE